MSSDILCSRPIDVMECIAVLLDLIEFQDWVKLDEVALSNPQTFKTISKAISRCDELHGMTLLHACVRYDPPTSLLQQVVNFYPQAIMGVDCMGRTPLHVATGCGASSYVIKLLTTYYPDACNIQDRDGRTPLHFACDTTCALFEDTAYSRSTASRGPPRLDVVRILLTGSLDAVILEDLDEMNAVEHAIVSDASIQVVNLLQNATQQVMKRGCVRNEFPQALPRAMTI